MSRYRRVLAIAIAASIVFAAPVAQSQIYQATFSGGAEVPSNPSLGTGSALVTYSAASQQMTVNTTFAGLSTGVTAAHIHCCDLPPLFSATLI